MLSQGQQTYVNNVLKACNDIQEAWVALHELANKVNTVGNDPDISLTTEQINTLLALYNARKTAIQNAVGRLP